MNINMSELCCEDWCVLINNVDCLLVIADNGNVLIELETKLLKETYCCNQLTRRGRQSQEFGFCS